MLNNGMSTARNIRHFMMPTGRGRSCPILTDLQRRRPVIAGKVRGGDEYITGRYISGRGRQIRFVGRWCPRDRFPEDGRRGVTGGCGSKRHAERGGRRGRPCGRYKCSDYREDQGNVYVTVWVLICLHQWFPLSAIAQRMKD